MPSTYHRYTTLRLRLSLDHGASHEVVCVWCVTSVRYRFNARRRNADTEERLSCCMHVPYLFSHYWRESGRWARAAPPRSYASVYVAEDSLAELRALHDIFANGALATAQIQTLRRTTHMRASTL